ncbi:DNA-3-methyladenine glycosylase 2 family protein [Lichenihabitans sp. Uapishka_5]|uniref:DNA-3-methyladenine glycosylase family protein n=1 Tax=Lichenihabitans sp. Uapishka_5 TaxID=3037302 RepID=UPI0029E7FD8C|nr:DNA-3-methyladenine glycosylase 2 family protein [Lichenihabitans sp. Uapishka_5]MDX7952059.1 DNA-3-methyladenine glycosylase 2 family protein [Lichenihabitans sp. Uapishka_5]
MRLTTDAALDAGLAGLSERDPAGFSALWTVGGRPALRHGAVGFAGLAATILGQQVSTASAAAMLGRLSAAIQPLAPATLLKADEATLRNCGLSVAKMATLRRVATAAMDGTLPLDRLAAMPAAEAHRRLVALKGIGPWTADVFLLFCQGEPDAFPAGDLALQEAYRLVFGGARRPDAARLTALAERWRPWRGVAAYLLWACYRARRGAGASMPPPAT